MFIAKAPAVLIYSYSFYRNISHLHELHELPTHVYGEISSIFKWYPYFIWWKKTIEIFLKIYISIEDIKNIYKINNNKNIKECI